MSLSANCNGLPSRQIWVCANIHRVDPSKMILAKPMTILKQLSVWNSQRFYKV